MRTEDRRIIKEIRRHQELESNLPAYGNSYINSVYEYNLIRLVLNYYTIKEVYDEGGTLLSDSPLLDTIEDINTILFETIISEDVNGKEGGFDSSHIADCVQRLDKIRNEITDRMVVLTAYTDALQIYEYVLNRIEFSITGQVYKVDVDDLSERLFKYIFNDNDKMVINSKIQMITAQLPVRMTKSKFYDYLNVTLNIYNGMDKASVDSFADMIRSTSLIDKPEGYGTLYPEISGLIGKLSEMDFKTVDKETFVGIMEQFSFTSSHLTDIVSNHLMVMEIINALYSVLLALPFERNEEESIDVCIDMIRNLHAAFVTSGDIPETVDDGFASIEGIQEGLGEDILQFESVLEDVIRESSDEVSWIMADELFSSLEKISKLMSNSLFIELNEKENDEETADSDYIKEKYEELIASFGAFFDEHKKEVNRAVMAAVFSNMPVLFNSVSEIKEYIEHSLSHCSNDSELMACAKLLDEMMAEE